ncbi:hypothetical protein M8818_001693 [Zalaria obscura]|uniref:Uncharacterized protein n=1 Tax=Zalaria obscura TaxID=2024903 RepID=A0ACC3SJ30_9PEZI
MRFLSISTFLSLVSIAATLPTSQLPLLRHAANNRTVSAALFSELEELARIVDISYCVGLTGIGISKPFRCLSRCSDFPDFELVTTWNTGQLMSDSCGYIALAHSPTNPRIIVAFRGTYSVANTVVDLSTVPQEYQPYPGNEEGDDKDAPRCHNCTVHTGFSSSWNITAAHILLDIEAAIATHPDYKLTLVGHSLGGAVAALAGLDFVARGWDPVVTTFGEPRIGNEALVKYIDARFNLESKPSETQRGVGLGDEDDYERNLRYRRVTHVDDPVPLLPLSEWGYRMHAGEIYITKPSLSPDITDLQHCLGDADQECIAGQDKTTSPSPSEVTLSETVKEASLWGQDGGSWTMPARYKLWQLFFAHRDYFWRLGLCVPGGDPRDWTRQPYSPPSISEDRMLEEL